MDFVHLSESPRVIDGLKDMMNTIIGENEYVQSYVNVEIALLICEIAKRAEDKDGWFPRGKWATIQAIQARINEQINCLF